MNKKEAIEMMSRAILQIEKEEDLYSAEIKIFESVESRQNKKDWRVIIDIQLNAG